MAFRLLHIPTSLLYVRVFKSIKSANIKLQDIGEDAYKFNVFVIPVPDECCRLDEFFFHYEPKSTPYKSKEDCRHVSCVEEFMVIEDV